MRPKKMRWVKCDSSERFFKPRRVGTKENAAVILTLDEFETVRLLDWEGLPQEAVAKTMKVHRSTVSRIISSARKKIAEALVTVKPLKIEGGCCRIVK